MNYLSTFEASKKWHISARRIAVLAKEGRIYGVVRVGNRWLIPDNASKPEDGRRVQKSSPYKFPLLYCSVSSDDQVENDFTEEEKSLYKAFLDYERGNFEEAITALDALRQNTTHQYIRIGALYLLYYSYKDSRQFEKAFFTSHTFRVAIAEASDHQEEYVFLLQEMDASSEGFDSMVDTFSIKADFKYSSSIIPYLMCYSASTDFLRAASNNSRMPISVHEISCKVLEEHAYYYSTMIMHYYLFVAHILSDSKESALYHLKEALDIALEHKVYYSICYLLSYLGDVRAFLQTLYPAETVEFIQGIVTRQMQTNSDYLAYIGKSKILSKLSANDFQLLTYLVIGCTTDEIAKRENTSVYSIRKNISRLCEIFRADSKKDLISKYNNELRYQASSAK